ncbi:MAG TPA: hypothetical protein VKU87_00020 [Thermomicrobiaceae bacterium]|nr:hypothetical protein [Thermomicrobiaceae bacterium]
MSMNFEAIAMLAKSEQRLRDIQNNQGWKYEIPSAVLQRQEPAAVTLPLLKRAKHLFSR